MDDEASPDQTGVAGEKGEKPDDALHTGLICELGLKARKVNLPLLARRGLEPHLEGRDRCRPNLAHRTLHRRVAASITAVMHLPPQPHRGEPRKVCQPLAKVRQEWISAPLPGRPWPIGRRLKAAVDVSA